MVKVNVIFNDIRLLICLTPLQVNWEKTFLLGGDRAGGKGVCGRLMSPVQETQSMWEIRLLN
jgi:hypothetical protein